MNCPNKSHPSWIKMVEKYGEEQALLKWIKNGEQFENIIDIKPGVSELFESNFVIFAESKTSDEVINKLLTNKVIDKKCS